MDSDSGHSRSSHHSSHSHRSRRKDKHRDKSRDRDTDKESDREHGRRRSRSRDRDKHRDRDRDRDREDRGHESDASHRSRSRGGERSVTIRTPPMVTDEERGEDEVIEVQILPQDDNWGENTTVITGATSEYSISNEDLTQFAKDMEASVGFDCSRYIGGIIALLLGIVAFLTPIAFVIIPLIIWDTHECAAVCQGLLISFSFKLVILLIGSFALFFRKPKATMPRVFWLRAVVMLLIVVFVVAYWLFYGFRIANTGPTNQDPSTSTDAPVKKSDYYENYESVVAYSLSLVDALLFIHYLAIVLLEIRQITTQFTIKVIRTSDGESRFYTLGHLSIQRAAVWLLEQYYRDFPVYNPYLQQLPSSRASKHISSFKFYDVDGGVNTTVTGRSRAILAANARRRDAGHNDRFYEEQEYDRRVKKRKARLTVAAEEAFTHIRRMNEEHGPANPMDPYEAAQAIFPSMARALQKYLRITRQQPRWTMESVLNHLANCIGHNFTPKAFLEQFFNPGPPILEHIREGRESQQWELICDQMANWPLKSNTSFMMRQGDVALFVYVMAIPHFQVAEEAFDHKNNKFVLRLQSETSV